MAVHMCTRRGIETPYWKTACGLKLDKKARAETTLADEWEYVTCRTCKKDEPEPPPKKEVVERPETRKKKKKKPK